MHKQEDSHMIRVLLVGFALLAIGEVYLFFANPVTKTSAVGAASAGFNTASESASLTPASGLIGAPVTAAVKQVPEATLDGAISDIGSSSFSIREVPTAQPISIAVTSATSYSVQNGVLKDAATQAADMAKYRAYVTDLERNPQQNAVALSHLFPPSPYISTTINLSDMKAGEIVTVYAVQQPDGSYVADQVIDSRQMASK